MARTFLTLGAALPGLALSFLPLACGGAETGAGGSAVSSGSTGGGGGASVSTTDSGGSGGSTSGTTSSTSSSSGGAGGSTGTGTGGSPIGCLQDVSPGHHKVSCDGGIDYDVEIPQACAGSPCGLVVDMHGYTMTGDSEDENTGMRVLGKQNGYVVVQPTAPKDNLQFPSWDQVKHAPLVFQFVQDVAASLPIDPARIHAMGFSQGGGMTFRLLCDHADFFASGAPIGAVHGCDFVAPSTPSQEVDILQVHGRKDAVVNFAGEGVPQRDAALAAWPFGQPTVLEDDGAHKATRWTTPSGTDFEFWEHDYTTSATVFFYAIQGHCVPGGTDFSGDPAGYSCEDPNTFVFGELAVQFFLAHPKD